MSLVSSSERVVIQPEYGLANRLRAISSAYSLSRKWGSELIVVWLPDEHCEAKLTDLFEPDFQVIQEEKALWEIEAANKFRYYDWTLGMRRRDELMAFLGHGPRFIASSKFFMTRWRHHARWARSFLRNLRPTPEVTKLIGEVEIDYPVSLHVRQVGGPGFDHLQYENASNWGAEAHASIGRARASSRPEKFVEFVSELEKSAEFGTQFPVYVAADNETAKVALTEHFGLRARFIPTELESRSVRQVQGAFAELLLLSKAEVFVGSPYSSFSELVPLLSEKEQRVTIVAID